MRSKLTSKLLIAVILACVGFVFAMLGATAVPVLQFVGIAFLVAAVIVNLTIRCPSCGHHLTGKRTMGVPNYCPHCGHKISDSEIED